MSSGATPLRVFPENIPIDVGYWKVQEHFHTPHLASIGDNFPVQMEPVRIEHAKGAPVVLPSNLRKNLVEENLVAVSLENLNVRTRSD